VNFVKINLASLTNIKSLIIHYLLVLTHYSYSLLFHYI